jgi:hypothetical protein
MFSRVLQLPCWLRRDGVFGVCGIDVAFRVRSQYHYFGIHTCLYQQRNLSSGAAKLIERCFAVCKNSERWLF